MKIGFIGDAHLRSTKPRNRTDNYVAELVDKFSYAYDYCFDHGCELFLQAGDLWDNPRVPNWLIALILKIIKGDPTFGVMKFITIFGQHDMHFHSLKVDNTPTNVLVAAGAASVAGKEPITVKNVNIYGCSWGEKIPKITTSGINILMIHRMIIKNEDSKLWEGQEDYTTSDSLLRKYKYNLIVSGDNHKRFVNSHGTKQLYNCGSLGRSGVDQIDHKPCFGIFDTRNQEVELLDIPIRDPKEVFDLDKVEEVKARTEELDAFIASLQSGYEIELDFKANLYKAMEANDISPVCKKIIEEVVGND